MSKIEEKYMCDEQKNRPRILRDFCYGFNNNQLKEMGSLKECRFPAKSPFKRKDQSEPKGWEAYWHAKGRNKVMGKVMKTPSKPNGTPTMRTTRGRGPIAKTVYMWCGRQIMNVWTWYLLTMIPSLAFKHISPTTNP